MGDIIAFPVNRVAKAVLPDFGGNYSYDVGSQYVATHNLDIAEIAKRVRADIKEAVKAGRLPKAKYGVRISRYSMGQSLNVTAKDFEGVEVIPVEYARLHAAGRWDEIRERRVPNYTPVVQDALITVKAILNQYNYDRSDTQSDYFDVRFYGDAKVDREYEQAVINRLVQREKE